MTINRSKLQQALEKMQSLQSEDDKLLKDLVKALSMIGNVSMMKGEKGDKGDKPVPGIDYPIPRDGYTPKKGIDYVDGKDGKDGIDGKDGRDGKDGIDGKSEEEILSIAFDLIERHEKENDHSLLHDKKELGSFKLDERTTQNGKILQVKDGKIIGVDMPDYSEQIQNMGKQFARPAKAHSRYKIQTVTESTTIDPLSNILHVDASAGDVTLTFYEPEGNEGSYTYIKRIDNSANEVTFATPNDETIDFESLYQLVNRGSGAEVYSDGSNLFIKHIS